MAARSAVAAPGELPVGGEVAAALGRWQFDEAARSRGGSRLR